MTKKESKEALELYDKLRTLVFYDNKNLKKKQYYLLNDVLDFLREISEKNYREQKYFAWLKDLGATQEDLDFVKKNKIDVVAIYSTKEECIKSEIFYRGEEFFDYEKDAITLPSGKVVSLRTRNKGGK